jgi:tetratricopeptide (TPR) repeat protein
MSKITSNQNLTHNRFYLLILCVIACILLVATCGTSFFRVVENNAWSLSFEQYSMGHGVFPQIAPDQHPRAVLWLARDALSKGDPQRAQTLVAQQATSGSHEALTILGDAYSIQGQFSAAVEAWTQAGDDASLLQAAADAKTAKEFDNALVALLAAYSINPEAAASPLASFLLDVKNDTEQAANMLQITVQQFPQSANQADWCYQLGRVYTKEKQYSEADKWYGLAVQHAPKTQFYWIVWANAARDSGDYAHALTIYAQALKQFPGYAQVYYEAAWAYKLAGSPDEALQVINQAISLADPPNAYYEVRAGQIYESTNNLDKALQAYQAAQSIDPGTGTAYLISYYRYTLKDIDGTISTLKQAISTYPLATQQVSWMLQLAGIYRDKSSWEEAKAAYQDLLTKDPNNADGYVGLGWTYYLEGEGLAAAQEQFQKAIDANISSSAGYYAMGQVLVREQRFSEADSWYAKAIERSPDNSSLWVERGNAARSAGNLDDAITLYGQAIQHFPNFAYGYYELAWAYKLKEDKSNAIQAIESAITYMSTPSEWYYVRAGQIYEWAGQNEQAIAAYRSALTLNSENSSAQQGLTRLGQ